MKQCSRCKQIKSETNFCKRKDRPSGFVSHCKRCQADDTLKYHFAWKMRVKVLKDKPCMDCGIQYPPFVMDFDHRDPSTKKFHFQVAKNWKDTLTEIAKCDLVCSNCHRVRTYLRTHRV